MFRLQRERARESERETRPHHEDEASSELLILHLEVCTEEEGRLDRGIPPFLPSIALINNLFHNRLLRYYYSESELVFITEKSVLKCYLHQLKSREMNVMNPLNTERV